MRPVNAVAYIKIFELVLIHVIETTLGQDYFRQRSRIIRIFVQQVVGLLNVLRVIGAISFGLI